MPAVLVREATMHDVEVLADVHVHASRAAYRGMVPQDHLDRLDRSRRQRAWQQILQDGGPAATLVAEHERAGVVGFIHVSPSRDTDSDPQRVGEIQALYLLPGFWGHGVGRLLMDEGVHRLAEAGRREIVLWVLATNLRARRFYEAGGWRADGSTKTNDSRGVDLTEVRYRYAAETPAPSAAPRH
jgi:ribosomal protein S18 acetylase RimI-like enzyme